MNNVLITEGVLQSIRNNYKHFSISLKIKENIELIVHTCSAEGVVMPEQVAYLLGTVWHESRFISQVERRATQGTRVFDMQEKYWHTGYFGRGFIQLTWKRNYELFSRLLGVDLVGNPSLALKEDIAAKVAVIGMRDGLFTGKKLSDYFKEGRRPLWLEARRIVNDMFHAAEVADAAKLIYRYVKHAF